MIPGTSSSPPEGSKKERSVPYGLLIKLGLSGLFVVILAMKLDSGQIWEAFQSTHLGLFLLSFVVMMLGEIPAAIRLKLLIGPTVVQERVARLLKVDIISRFYTFFLPGGIGVALSRWYKITGNKVGRGQFAVVLIVEKSLWVAVSLAAVGVPLLLSDDARIQPFKTAFLPAFFFLVGALSLLYACLFLPWAQDTLVAYVNRRIGGWLPEKAAGAWDKVTHAAMIYRGRWGVFVSAVLVSLVIHAFFWIGLFLLFLAVQVPLPMLTILWISSLVFLVQMLPISFSGIGVRESGYAYLVSLYGFAPEKGVLIGLLFLVLYVGRALIGGLLELTEREPVHARTRGAMPRV